MRGANQEQDSIFSYHSPADRVPSNHPLRVVKEMANRALKGLSADFNKMYSATGRPSIPPEKLIRALLLQVLYSIRSERLLMEELNYNLLFRWFVGLSMEDEVLGPLHILQESGSAAERGHRGEVLYPD